MIVLKTSISLAKNLKHIMRYVYLLAFLVLVSCVKVSKETKNSKSLFEKPYVALFERVLKDSVLADNLNFVDAKPKGSLESIWKDYLKGNEKNDFDLQEFILDNFDVPSKPKSTFEVSNNSDIETYMSQFIEQSAKKIESLPNSQLFENATTNSYEYSSSYFSMLGLVASGKISEAKNMVDNYAFLIDKHGYVPCSAKSYQIERSGPPYFSLMVRLLSEKDTSVNIEDYLPQMEKEYSFWMKDSEKLSIMESASARVVLMPHGEIMNRYWSGVETPRPENYLFDKSIAGKSEYDSASVYRNLRAGSESSWEFSSRWLGYTKGFGTLETTSLVPIDLNCLLYHLELTIAESYQHRNDGETYERYAVAADYRKNAILKYCWIEEEGFFIDYSFVDQYHTGVQSLSGLYPLYFDIATADQIFSIVDKLENDFLKDGGLVSTLNETGQVWDSPNCYAGLQYIAVRGLRNYDYAGLADDVVSRWLIMVDDVYEETRKTHRFYNADSKEVFFSKSDKNMNGDNSTNGVYLWLLHGN
ncbi:MAG: alpha,alpha-trehalase [Arenicella sp.]|jgi:alpha,alpha-trehalase